MSNGSVFGVCVGRVLFGVRILAGGGGQGPRSGSAEGFEPAVGRPVPPFAPPLTHGGGLVIARVPLLARCGGVVCLLA